MAAAKMIKTAPASRTVAGIIDSAPYEKYEFMT